MVCRYNAINSSLYGPVTHVRYYVTLTGHIQVSTSNYVYITECVNIIILSSNEARHNEMHATCPAFIDKTT